MLEKYLTKEQIITVPNLLSFVRILLIPVIVWLYFGLHNSYLAFGVIVLSGITDIIDGKIARKFNMISDFGKFLDPVADKLTQFVVFIFLSTKYRLLILLVVLFFLKELISFIAGYFTVKKINAVHSAKWHGKLNTILLYATLSIMLLIPNLSPVIADILIIVCCLSMCLSFSLYLILFRNSVKETQANDSVA